MKYALLFATLLATGCATSSTRIKLMQNNFDAGTLDPSIKKVTGESCKRSILWVVPLEKDGSLQDAIDNALTKAPGANALADIKVTGHNLMTVVYNYRCVEVEGRPVAMK